MYKKNIVPKLLLLLLFALFAINAQSQINEDKEDEPIDTVVVPQKPITLKHKGSMSTIDSIIAFSRTFIGTPYRYGGTTTRGFDCSGFMVFLFKKFAINLPRTGTSQYQSHTDIERKTIKKGDLVFFSGRRKGKRIGHVGMVVSDTIENENFYFIHSSTNRGVIISNSNEEYYANRYISACRIIDVIKDSLSDNMVENCNRSVFHTVKKGETIYSIAKLYSVKVDSIKIFNDITNDKIRQGQSLLVKKAKKQGDKVKEKTDNNSPKHSLYKVKKGDTLYSIAKKYNISVSQIKKDNNLFDNRLGVGQTIIIKK